MGTLAFEPGRYLGRIVKWGMSAASTGTPQFFVTFVPLGKIDPGKPEGENLLSCAVWERTVFRAITENTIDFVARDLKSLGYELATFDQLEPEHPQAHDFMDMEIQLVCKHEEYKGAMKERWDFAFGDGFTPKAVEASGMKKLNALFGKKLKSATKAPTAAEKNANSKEKADAAKKEMEEVL